MTYNSEQLEKLFKKHGTQFFKIVAGSNPKGGSNKGSSINIELSEDKPANTEMLWNEFLDTSEALPDGTYTVICRTSAEAHKNETAYIFTVGDVKMGNTGVQNSQRTDTQMRGGDAMLAMLFQTMQAQQNTMIQLMSQSFDNARKLENSIRDKELELYKAQNAKASTFMDKMGNAIEKHLPVIVSSLTNAPAVGVGRATAPQSAQVPADVVNPSVTPEQMEEYMKRGQRINGVLSLIEAEFPETDAISILEMYVPEAIQSIKNQSNEA